MPLAGAPYKQSLDLLNNMPWKCIDTELLSRQRGLYENSQSIPSFARNLLFEHEASA